MDTNHVDPEFPELSSKFLKSNKIFCILFSFATLSLYLLPHFAFADTQISGGTLSGEIYWNKEGSPYIINGNVEIAPGSNLQIGPGTTVKFSKDQFGSWYYLWIKGGFGVSGTPEERVRFTTIDDNFDGGEYDGNWLILVQSDHNISISNASFSHLDYLSFYGNDNVILSDVEITEISGGLNFSDVVSATIKNSNFLDFRYSGVFSDGGTLSVENSNFKNFQYATALVANQNLSLQSSHFQNISGGGALSAYNGSVYVNDSMFENGQESQGLSFLKADTFISSSTVSGFDYGGIFVGGGKFNADQIVINGNLDSGIIFQDLNDGPVPTFANDAGGDQESPFVYKLEEAKISKSKIYENEVGIKNNATKAIEATQNWWGDKTGPKNLANNPGGLGNEVVGSINFAPWLESENQELNGCCSSVVFLPGIKGSVLEKVSVVGGDDTIWPPTVFTSDVRELALTENGESKYPVVVSGILNTFYGTPIYQGFSDFMDQLKTIDSNTGTSTIKEWLPLAYDWRFSPERIIKNGINTKEGNIDVVGKIEELAANSYSGKVTLVSHSMGGLLGKAIIKELQNRGKESLIDNFIMVGTPQSGTPQAVSSLLHGDGEGIVGGFVVNASEMRVIGQNMQSAHNLLPSAKHFEEVSEPMVLFSTDNFTQKWRDLWGDTIDSYPELKSFLTGVDGREIPQDENLLEPTVLKQDLIETSESFHQYYDTFIFPENIKVIQIAGWGLPTLKSIEYKNYHGKPSYKGVFTTEGDGTVVYPSALSTIIGDKYYFNLSTYNSLENVSDVKHRDILSANQVQDFIYNLLNTNRPQENQFIKIIKPVLDNENEKLSVSTHSPVILGAFDSSGNFTGIDPNQDLSKDVLQIKEEIPGSSFINLGDSQYIFLPKEGKYNFLFKGIDSGQATVEIENFVGNKTEPVVSFTDISVNVSTNAKFDVVADKPQETVISVDKNGDGTPDELVLRDGVTIQELLKDLRGMVQTLQIKSNVKKNLLNRIDRLERKIEKKKGKNREVRISKILENLDKKINNLRKKGKIDELDANGVLNILDQIESLL